MSGSITMSSFGSSFGETAGAPFDCGMVRRAVEQLPPEERAALLLHWLHGLKYGEIADELSLPVSGVQALIADARAALRTMVGSSQSAPAH
jgi:DNA-directed RNA polymerase specialized sigma24 family protein